jgi:predicted methyltransferase
MYDQAKQSELIRFARVDAGSTVIDVYPGDGDWTRLFSDVVGPEGRVYSFVPAEVAHFKNDPVGRMRRLRRSRAERTSKPSRRTSSRCRRPRNQRMSCGCTCSTTISTPR